MSDEQRQLVLDVPEVPVSERRGRAKGQHRPSRGHGGEPTMEVALTWPCVRCGADVGHEDSVCGACAAAAVAAAEVSEHRRAQERYAVTMTEGQGVWDWLEWTDDDAEATVWTAIALARDPHERIEEQVGRHFNRPRWSASYFAPGAPFGPKKARKDTQVEYRLVEDWICLDDEDLYGPDMTGPVPFFHYVRKGAGS